MSETREECYNCSYYSKCYERANFGSEYCKIHNKNGGKEKKEFITKTEENYGNDAGKY